MLARPGQTLHIYSYCKVTCKNFKECQTTGIDELYTAIF